MSDQTPRVPDIWWSPTKALVGGYKDRVYFTLQVGHVTELSADTVKLGDVEGLKRQLEAQRQLHNREMQQGVEAVRKLNGIREAVADFERHGTNGPRTPGSMLRDVLDILDRPAAAPGERDQGGEYPCTSCGTTGWDCLTAMNASPVDARCCADCGLNDTHSRPAAAPAEPREDTVPCGRDDEDCSLRGGTAHCGGCRE